MNFNSILASEKNVFVNLRQFDQQHNLRSLPRANFQLYFLCNVPIFAFQFGRPEDVVVIPLSLRSFDTWPANESVVITMRLRDDCGLITAQKDILLSRDETKVIARALAEQQYMTFAEVSCIEEEIYRTFPNEQPLPEKLKSSHFSRYSPTYI